MGHVTLITGGARSGKSRYALELAAARPRPVFIATARATDDEMRARIARHKAERDARFQTLEEPYDLAHALQSLPGGADVAVVDCLTVWLGNLMTTRGIAETYPEVRAFLHALDAPPCDLVLVTNEVGMGVVPAFEMGRAFRDLAGSVNQQVARRAGTVVFMVSGLPMFLKRE